MKHPIIAHALIIVFVAQGSFANSFVPLPSANSIILNFDGRIASEVRDSINQDFQRSLAISTRELSLYHLDADPTNKFMLSGLWQPYSFAATNPLGPDLPERGVLSNDTFIIDVSYDFATNYQHLLDSTIAYSNEIAAAYAFIEALSPTNLSIMSTNELLSLDLWKDIHPGQHPQNAEKVDSIISYCRARRVSTPPRFAFCVWECGPTNSPPYLWCFPPSYDERNNASSELMIYFQNRWWFTEWFLHPGKQQW